MTSSFLPSVGLFGAGAGAINALGAVQLVNTARISTSEIAGEVSMGSGVLTGAIEPRSKTRSTGTWLPSRTVTVKQILWSTAGDQILWGTCDGDHVVWGTAVGDHILWGTSTGDQILWGTSTHGDQILWGTSAGDVLWSTAIPGDQILWGTSTGDQILWGTADGNF